MKDLKPNDMRRAAVIGWPVSHSLSPLIHATWAAREGVNARYEAIAVEPSDDAFRTRISDLRAEGFAGVNVTIPHKERALKIADRASAAATAIGAANMLTFAADGVLAENSDAAAISDIIKGLPAPPSSALVLGAGGAARGIVFALANGARPPKIILANRTRARAEEIAAIANAEVIDWSQRSDVLDNADLIVNATSLGMKGQPPLEIDDSRFKEGAVILDIVYAPLETPLLAAAKARGCRAIDGLEMLMRQAAPGYRAWLGNKAEVDADLRARLEAALKARGS